MTETDKLLVLKRREIDLVKAEYLNLKRAIERALEVIEHQREEDFLVQNRTTLLTGIFGKLDEIIKICDDEKRLGGMKTYQTLAMQVNLLSYRARLYRKYFLERTISTKEQAYHQFRKVIKEFFESKVAIAFATVIAEDKVAI